MPIDHNGFRQQLLSHRKMIGAFVKTPGVQPVEILAEVGFDFLVLDEEHAALDRAAIDVGLLACRAHGCAGLVRVSGPQSLLGVLDCGAAGVMAPHVSSEAQAREIASLCRYRNGRRGFSGSPRVGRYGGVKMADLIEAADGATTVIAQIEDSAALDVIDAIAAVPGIDALFLGRADLAVAMGLSSPDAPEIQDAVLRVMEAARAAGKPVCAFVVDAEDATRLEQQGVSAFVLSSDQGFLRTGATGALASLRST